MKMQNILYRSKVIGYEISDVKKKKKRQVVFNIARQIISNLTKIDLKRPNLFNTDSIWPKQIQRKRLKSTKSDQFGSTLTQKRPKMIEFVNQHKSDYNSRIWPKLTKMTQIRNNDEAWQKLIKKRRLIMTKKRPKMIKSIDRQGPITENSIPLIPTTMFNPTIFSDKSVPFFLFFILRSAFSFFIPFSHLIFHSPFLSHFPFLFLISFSRCSFQPSILKLRFLWPNVTP